MHRRPLIDVPSPSPRRTGKFGTASSPPLDRVLASTAPPPRREVSSSPLCDINVGAVHPTGARRAPPLPSPRAPIKGRPGAPPSPHRPQPPPFSPRQAQFREAPPSSSPPMSSPPFSRPLCWSSERLNQPTSFPSLPRTQHTTFSPQSLAQSSPTAIPAAELCHLPADSPSRPPLAKSSLPLGSPAPARAKPPPRGPRTGPPAAGFSFPADGRFTRVVDPRHRFPLRSR
jgi:hypothetical protein